MHAHTCTHTHTHTHAHTHTHTCKHPHTHAHIYTRTLTHAHAHLHAHTHAHTQRKPMTVPFRHVFSRIRIDFSSNISSVWTFTCLFFFWGGGWWGWGWEGKRLVCRMLESLVIWMWAVLVVPWCFTVARLLWLRITFGAVNPFLAHPWVSVQILFLPGQWRWAQWTM